MIDRILLFPYTLTLAVRDFLYRSGLKKRHKAEVPTICVGNITVGGTGKTPHTEMIIRTLLGSARWGKSNISVLSRGYKRRTCGFQHVTADGTATLYGDEPLQMARKFPGVTVAVDRNRVEGAGFLCHPDKLQTSRKARRCKDKNIPATDIIVLDDAFQYRRLDATVNILLIDYNRPLHTDRLLPIGRLRDFPSRTADADIIIVTKCPAYLNEWERSLWANKLGISSYSNATCKGQSRRGREQTLLFTSISYCPMTPVFPEGDPRYTYSHRLVLFTGIARDTPLRHYLSDKYKIIRGINFPDHHKYSNSDLRMIASVSAANPTAVIATTEKDAQRVVDTPKIPGTLKERLFQVPIEVFFLTENEKTVFESTLLAFLG